MPNPPFQEPGRKSGHLRAKGGHEPPEIGKPQGKRRTCAPGNRNVRGQNEDMNPKEPGELHATREQATNMGFWEYMFLVLRGHGAVIWRAQAQCPWPWSPGSSRTCFFLSLTGGVLICIVKGLKDRNYSPGYMEIAPSRGHEASPQSGLGAGCKLRTSSKKLRGLSARAQARRISISIPLSFSVAGVSSFLSSPRSVMRRGAW